MADADAIFLRLPATAFRSYYEEGVEGHSRKLSNQFNFPNGWRLCWTCQQDCKKWCENNAKERGAAKVDWLLDYVPWKAREENEDEGGEKSLHASPGDGGWWGEDH